MHSIHNTPLCSDTTWIPGTLPFAFLDAKEREHGIEAGRV